MPYSAYLCDKINDHVLRGDIALTSYEQPTQISLSLHNASPGPTNDPDSEISGGSYERQIVTFAASSNGISSNTDEIIFSLVPTTTITHVALWDQSGNMLWYDDITSITVSTGDNIRIPAGALQVRAITTD